MRTIVADAAGWTEPDDFYRSVLPLLGAPEWQQQTLEALWENIANYYNDVFPPYTLIIKNLSQMAEDLLPFLVNVSAVFDDVRDQLGLDVYCQLEAGEWHGR